MSLINKVQHTEASQSPERDAFSLSKTEIELLLMMIKDSSFKGEDIETLYTLVYKLQKQYINQ